jgi:hypothetical protein
MSYRNCTWNMRQSLPQNVMEACSLRSQESTFVGRSEGRTLHPNGSLLAPIELRLLAESCWMLTKVSPRWRLSWLKKMALRA